MFKRTPEKHSSADTPPLSSASAYKSHHLASTKPTQAWFWAETEKEGKMGSQKDQMVVEKDKTEPGRGKPNTESFYPK